MKRPAGNSLTYAHCAVVASCLTVGALASSTHAQDTIRVNSNAAPLWGSSIKLTLTKELGLADGPDEYSFGSLNGVVFDKIGRMYTYDDQDNRIRQYDASLKFVREIGRSGAGPGEYKAVAGLAFVDDSILVVKDPSLARVSFFFPDGRLRGSITNRGFGSVGRRDFIADADGFVTFRAFRNDPALAQAKDPLDRLRYSQIKRLRPDGSIADSISMPTALPSVAGKMSVGGATNFHPETHFAVIKSGGFVVGDGNAYRFMIRPNEGPVRLVERRWTPLPLGKEERENWLEYATHFTEQSKKRPGTMGPEQYLVPTVKPAFRDIFTDEDSRIWVSLYAAARKVTLPPRVGTATGPRLYWRQPETYDVYSNQGVYLARIVMPDGLGMPRAKGNKLWLTTTGPNDEEVIRIYTMTGNAALKP